jgi:hypothetical protein
MHGELVLPCVPVCAALAMPALMHCTRCAQPQSSCWAMHMHGAPVSTHAAAYVCQAKHSHCGGSSGGQLRAHHTPESRAITYFAAALHCTLYRLISLWGLLFCGKGASLSPASPICWYLIDVFSARARPTFWPRCRDDFSPLISVRVQVRVRQCRFLAPFGCRGSSDGWLLLSAGCSRDGM